MVDRNIDNIYKIFILFELVSVNICTKFKNGIIDIRRFVLILIINAIIPGKKLIKEIGVRAL